MHLSSYNGMQALAERYLSILPSGSTVVDIGSQQVDRHMTYRPIVEGLNLRYVGADIKQAPNVDIVMPGEYDTGMDADSVDAVISGQCLEHCRNPFRLVAEMARMLKPKSYCLLVAPRAFKDHRYPVDCWRFLPDGMSELLSQAGLKVIHSWVTPGNSSGAADCWGVGVKL